MIETILALLLYICVLALVFYVVLWVLRQIGVSIPDQIMKILYVIFVLIVLIMLYRALVIGDVVLPRFG